MNIKDKVQKRFEVFEFNERVITLASMFTLPAPEMKQLLTHIKDLETKNDTLKERINELETSLLEQRTG